MISVNYILCIFNQSPTGLFFYLLFCMQKFLSGSYQHNSLITRTSTHFWANITLKWICLCLYHDILFAHAYQTLWRINFFSLSLYKHLFISQHLDLLPMHLLTLLFTECILKTMYISFIVTVMLQREKIAKEFILLVSRSIWFHHIPICCGHADKK